MWTYVNGTLSDNGFSGNYEERGVPSPTAVPNRRPFGGSASPPPVALTFTDNNGDLVLFRGDGSNDLWRYNIATNQWVWLVGEDPIDGISFYDYISPWHTSHDNGVLWTDSDNNYLFLDDGVTTGKWVIWKLDTSTLTWSEEKTYNNFSNDFDPLFRNETGDDTSFGSIDSPTFWNVDNEYLWFFGGTSSGFSSNWMYRLNLETYQWSWYNGTAFDGGSFRTRSAGFAYRREEARAINLPRPREKPITWVKNGKLYLGYGSGREAAGLLYDVWSYDLSDYNFTYELGRTHNGDLFRTIFQWCSGCTNNKVDTAIHTPEPFTESFNVGAIHHEGRLYQFDERRELYLLNDETGIYELLREALPQSIGELGVASEEVYPRAFNILGVVDNEIYGIEGDSGLRLYKYNIETKLFTCLLDNQLLFEGPPGEFNDQNVPRMDGNYASWVDSDKLINLFAGRKVWQFDPMLNQWAFMSDYEEDRELVPDYYRSDSKFSWWIDEADDLWIFNYSMWKYDNSEATWELIKHGMPEVNTSEYGEQERFSVFNNPSARLKFINWTDDRGRFWMANGRAIYEINSSNQTAILDTRVYNDMWMFDPRAEAWVWIRGHEGPIERNQDTLFRRYDIEQPFMNVRPIGSTGQSYNYHNTYSYNQDTELTVLENADGTLWKMDYDSLIPDYNLIAGIARYAADGIECNRRDQLLEGVQIIVDDFDGFTFTDESGSYTQFCNDKECQVTTEYNLSNNEYFEIVPNDTLVVFYAYGQQRTVDFCMLPRGDFDDADIVLLPLDAATRGFDSDYELIYKNKGTTTVSGQVKLYFNKRQVDVISFEGDTIGFMTTPQSDFQDSLIWQFKDLRPFETRKLDLTFEITRTQATTNIQFQASVCLDSSHSDYMPEDNIFILNQPVVGSFDPNDKTLLEGTVLAADKIGDYVHYHIRFENTGTANARFIFLEDFINEEDFDLSSFIPVAASHNYEVSIEDKNKLTVYFADINLPFRENDGNKGYFTFKIKTKDGLQIGDEIKNQASIHFDYNEPIITNEAVAIFGLPDEDGDGFTSDEDCDDTNPNINPNQTEIVYNGLDDDCNPVTLDDDLDRDGFTLADDCDDTDPNISPGQTERPYNGLDDDCNSQTPDDDLDQDGFLRADDCDDNNANVSPAQVEIPYNGLDDDCDAMTLDDDLDQDGFVLTDDCNDTDPNIHPNQTETVYNGVDDDCNPETLDDDLDQDGFVLAEDCNDNDATISPGQNEDPYNGQDDDCNPATLDDDLDQDGFLLSEDCDDNDPTINPDKIEIAYNGADDDCDPVTLDDDLDQDGFPIEGDCDDTDAMVNPNVPEEPYNGIDDDCNATTLDDDLDQDGFLLVDDCDDTNAEINPNAVDIPSNGIDENCDGMDLISSIHELSDAMINIYPNPAIDLINIEVDGQLNFEATLFDIQGKLITHMVNATVINIAKVPAGLYLLEIRDQKSGQKVVERIEIGR